jgi:hypothetical protein
MRQYTAAYVSIRPHTSADVRRRPQTSAVAVAKCVSLCHTSESICQHTAAYGSLRQHTAAYVSIRQRSHKRQYLYFCTNTCVSICTCILVLVNAGLENLGRGRCVSIRQHTSAYVSIRQHTSAYVSIRQHTSASAYVSIRQHTLEEHLRTRSTQSSMQQVKQVYSK